MSVEQICCICIFEIFENFKAFEIEFFVFPFMVLLLACIVSDYQKNFGKDV